MCGVQSITKMCKKLGCTCFKMLSMMQEVVVKCQRVSANTDKEVKYLWLEPRLRDAAPHPPPPPTPHETRQQSTTS